MTLSHERLLECLDYDPETGVFTYRIARHYLQKVGAVVGSDDGRGYLQIRIDGTKHWAQRLAWFYVNGQWPQHGIDHINGNPSDNRIANLRDATQAQNLCNKAKQSNNRSGVKGVAWHKAARKWVAQIGVGKTTVYLGLFENIDDAAKAYKEAALVHHGEFARIE